MTALEHQQAAPWQLLRRSKPHDLSVARARSEPESEPGFDVDEKRIETVSRDRSFRHRHAQIQSQVNWRIDES